MSRPRTLAAIVFARGEDVNAIVAAFAAAKRAEGVRAIGFIQVAAATPGCECPDTHVLDLETGARTPILQNLGRGSQGCRADPAAIAAVSQHVLRALAACPDLLIINRFGRLEAEGRGMLDEIAAAAISGVPTLIGVATRYLPQWRAFAADIADELPCSREALDAWWREVGALNIA